MIEDRLKEILEDVQKKEFNDPLVMNEMVMMIDSIELILEHIKRGAGTLESSASTKSSAEVSEAGGSDAEVSKAEKSGAEKSDAENSDAEGSGSDASNTDKLETAPGAAKRRSGAESEANGTANPESDPLVKEMILRKLVWDKVAALHAKAVPAGQASHQVPQPDVQQPAAPEPTLKPNLDNFVGFDEEELEDQQEEGKLYTAPKRLAVSYSKEAKKMRHDEERKDAREKKEEDRLGVDMNEMGRWADEVLGTKDERKYKERARR